MLWDYTIIFKGIVQLLLFPNDTTHTHKVKSGELRQPGWLEGLGMFQVVRNQKKVISTLCQKPSPITTTLNGLQTHSQNGRCRALGLPQYILSQLM